MAELLWLSPCGGDVSLPPTNPSRLCPQLYELDADPKRKEFLDDLFSFMQKRGEHLPGQKGLMGEQESLL